MSLILRYFGATPSPSRNPDDDRWWDGGAATQSVAGVRVDADTALKISTVWACRALLAETIASLPLVVFRTLPNGGRERARNNPLYTVLHDQPNMLQTAAEFREMMTGHVVMTGNAFALIKPGPRGAVDQLEPIHPDRIPRSNVERLPNGRLRYKVKQDDGSTRTFNQDDIFHLRGPSKDGIWGMSVIDYAIDSFGLTMAAERYGGRFFRNDSRPGGALRTPNKLSSDAAKRLKAGWEAAHTGGNQHRVAVLEEGLEWQQIGISPDEAQFLESREFQAEDVCRWFRVPPHMVGLTSKATSWGSGIEQMSLGFVTYTLLPWLTRWTQAISRDLILNPEQHFADFVLEGLLRGETISRYNAYAIARQWGWLSVNEIRRLENMNPVPNGGDVYLQPMNMEPAGGGSFSGALAAGNEGGSESTEVNDKRIRNVDAGENADPRASLNGAQIASLLEIVIGVARKTLSKETAVEVMVASFPFDEVRAREILKDVQPGDMSSTENAKEAIMKGHYRLLAEEAAGRLVRKEQAALSRVWHGKDEDWETAVEDFYDSHAGLVSQTLRVSLETAQDYCQRQIKALLNEGIAWLNDDVSLINLLADLAMERGA